MTNNAQLPAELEADVEAWANQITEPLKMDNDYQIGYNNGMEAGALSAGTHFAEKLHQAKQDIEELRRRLIISEAACSALNEQETEARDLLRIFISRHEAGLLPDRFIYNDIKSFLDGQK